MKAKTSIPDLLKNFKKLKKFIKKPTAKPTVKTEQDISTGLKIAKAIRAKTWKNKG